MGSTLRANVIQKLQVPAEASEPSTKAGESSKKSTVRSLVIQSKSSVPSKSNSSKQLLPNDQQSSPSSAFRRTARCSLRPAEVPLHEKLIHSPPNSKLGKFSTLEDFLSPKHSSVVFGPLKFQENLWQNYVQRTPDCGQSFLFYDKADQADKESEKKSRVSISSSRKSHSLRP